MKSLNEQIVKEREELIESKSEQIYNALKEAQTLDEGFFSTVVGGLVGVTAGASIMKAVCKGLGIEKGVLYNLLTSKLICGVAGAQILNNNGKK